MLAYTIQHEKSRHLHLNLSVQYIKKMQFHNNLYSMCVMVQLCANDYSSGEESTGEGLYPQKETITLGVPIRMETDRIRIESDFETTF